MPRKQNFLLQVRMVLWWIQLPYQSLEPSVNLLLLPPFQILFLTRNLRRKSHLPQSSRKLLEKSATDKKIEELNQKWSDRFNRLEALLMSKTFQPTFSLSVKVTPTHSPPTTIAKDTEPFFHSTSSERTGQDFSAMHQSASQLSQETTITSEHTGRGSSAALHQPFSQLRSDLQQQKSSPKCTVSDFSAAKHQSTSQLVSDRPRPDSSPKRKGSDSSAFKHQSSSQLSSDRHQPKTSERTGTDSSALRYQSTSQLTSHRPLTDLDLQCLPTPALICTNKGRTVLLVAVLRPVVRSLTDQL